MKMILSELKDAWDNKWSQETFHERAFCIYFFYCLMVKRIQEIACYIRLKYVYKIWLENTFFVLYYLILKNAFSI